MPAPNLSPIPSDSPWIGTARDKSGKTVLTPYLSDDAQAWLLEQQTRLNLAPVSVGASVSLTEQNASIGATPAYTTEAQGLYRVSVSVRVTTVASVNSSILVTIAWTDGGVACSFAYTAATGNTTSTVIVQPPLTLRVDQATAITYATTYASNAAGEMKYALDVVVEQVPG